MINYRIKQFKSLAVALKEIEPFIRNGQHLRTGRPFKQLGSMRSREILANWLACVVINATSNRDLTFGSDPIGGDGIISDRITGKTWPTEHVMVPRLRPGKNMEPEALIRGAIELKRHKGGLAYAAGKTLIIFMEAGGGQWFPNRAARQLPDPLLFETVWVVGLHTADGGKYVYNVTSLDLSNGHPPVFLVGIGDNFESWVVERLQ